jgi:hypothetical protein
MGKHKARNRRWMKVQIALARLKGDRRPRQVIEEDIDYRSEERRRMWAESFHDREIRETVVDRGRYYPLLGINEGEVLTQSLVYSHPLLTAGRL